jgi:hypothetical protein
MTRNVDLLRAVHVGGRMEAGVIRWTEDTNSRLLDLVVARTRDAVSTFLSTDYLARYVADMEAAAGVQVTAPAATVAQVSKTLGYSDATADAILSAFIAGGDTTALGVGHAVTAVAVEVANSDTAATMEADFFRACELAVSAAG